VRVGCSGAAEAFGRDEILRGRRECGRGAELGLGRAEIPPGVVSTLPTALPARPPSAATARLDGLPEMEEWLASGAVLERTGLLAATAPADAAGGSEPDRAPTV
jgi:hypothetical protein